MKFKLEIRLGNEAMETGWHIADALRVVASHINDLENMRSETGTIRDLNGNTVGSWRVMA